MYKRRLLAPFISTHFSRKLASLMLVFSFFLGPVALVLAEEVAVPEQVMETENLEQQPPLEEETVAVVETPTEQESEEEILIDEDQEMMSLMAGSVGGPGSLTLSPDTRTSLSPYINDLDGSLSYTYDIKVPPGRNEITTPKVSLVYDSRHATNDSIIGSGWSIVFLPLKG